MFRRLFLKLDWTSKVFLLWKPLLKREVICCCAKLSLKQEIKPAEDWRLGFLIKTEGSLGCCWRLLESRRVICFYWGESCFLWKQQWFWMIVSMNSKTFTVYATVACPLAFLDWGTVEIVTCWCRCCGYCSTQWLVLILNSNRIASICIISRGIPFVRIKSRRIIIMAVLMVPVKQITKPTI